MYLLIWQNLFDDMTTHGTHRPERYIAWIEIALSTIISKISKLCTICKICNRNTSMFHLTFPKVSKTTAVSSPEIVRLVAYAKISLTDRGMFAALDFKISLRASPPGRSLGTWRG
jgi:hypothetical protein